MEYSTTDTPGNNDDEWQRVVDFCVSDFSDMAAFIALRISIINYSKLIHADNYKDKADKILKNILEAWKKRTNVFVNELVKIHGNVKLTKTQIDRLYQSKKAAEAEIRDKLSITPTVEDMSVLFKLDD